MKKLFAFVAAALFIRSQVVKWFLRMLIWHRMQPELTRCVSTMTAHAMTSSSLVPM